MSIFLIGVILILGFVGIGFAIYFTRANKNANAASSESLMQIAIQFQKDLGSFKIAVNEQIQGLSRQMNEQLAQNSNLLIKSHEGYRQSVGQVENRLGELQEAARSMVQVGRDISSLQDILKSPKLRGGLGELLLSELLTQILPTESYALQYSFRNGSKVDAVVFLGQGIVPIDAKFPLENFRRIIESKNDEEVAAARKAFLQDVKKHIDSISSKYILPEEGTFEFAIMYIPAENVYYETIIKDEHGAESLSEYSMKRKVIPVSPNSFYVYLQSIVRGLKGLRIEKSAQKILESLGQLDTDLNKLLNEFEKMGGHLSNAQSSYERARKGFEKLESRLALLQSSATGEIPAEPTSIID